MVKRFFGFHSVEMLATPDVEAARSLTFKGMFRMLVVGLLALILCSATPAAGSCSDLLQDSLKYTSSHEAAVYTGDNMLFFLHIPRTAGGTLNCLLRAAVAPERRCPSAYKALPDAEKLANCTLVASHDDFSALQHLPAGTAVLTELRDPVDRVLSAYEFAIEQAAQRINKTKQQAAGQLSDVLAYSLTEDVWPWSILVPFFAQDITPKLQTLKAKPLEPPGVWTIQRNPDGTRFYYNRVVNASKASLSDEEQKLLKPELDAYDNDIVMSLKDFLGHPIATELLHNGETLQVLGLTNYSSWPQAAALRECMLTDSSIADQLLQVAKQRLERFTYVGATSKLQQSVQELVSSLGWSFNQTAHPFTEADVSAALLDVPGPESHKQQVLQEYKKRIASQGRVPLSEDFYKCAAAGRTGAHDRRSRSLRRLRLNDWRQIYFDKGDRASIPRDIIETIRNMNHLDVQLFEHAQKVIEKQREGLTASGRLQVLPPKASTAQNLKQGSKPSTMEGQVADGVAMPLNGAEKQKVQGLVMQQLQKYLSRKSTSEL